jgi:hypothetical protein
MRLIGNIVEWILGVLLVFTVIIALLFPGKGE